MRKVVVYHTPAGVTYDQMVYDFGTDYQMPAHKMTPAELAAASKNKSQQDVKTFNWVYSQATNGSVSAMESLGELYMRGKGTDKDIPAGKEWLKRAANQGDVHASNILSRISTTNAVPVTDAQ
jgi:TPR repeat protein